MKPIENLKDKILKDYKRYGLEDKFTFACHPGVPCFNNCCSDVNIFLTPLDIIRLRKNLGITSEEFLEKYTLTPFDVHQSHPVVLFKMQNNEKKSCHFVGPQGCSVYKDRPWSCRMYPLGKASPSGNNTSDNFYFLLEEDICKGFHEPKQWTVKEWIDNQEVDEFDMIGEMFKEVSLHKYFLEGKQLNPQKMEMFHMVCYNIDKFKKFVFESSFLERFDIPDDVLKKIKDDDIELLKFGFEWLKFSLFEDKVENIKIRKS